MAHGECKECQAKVNFWNKAGKVEGKLVPCHNNRWHYVCIALGLLKNGFKVEIARGECGRGHSITSEEEEAE